VALLLLWPLLAPGVLALCIVAPLAWYCAIERRLPLYEPAAPTFVLVVAAAYMFLNIFWSPAPVLGLQLAIMFLGLVGVQYVTLAALERLDAEVLGAMAMGSLLGLLVAGAVHCAEIFEQQALRRLLLTHVPALRPNPAHMQLQGDRVTALAPYLMNRGTTLLVLMFWPAVLMAGTTGFLRSRAVRVAVVMLLAAAVFTSESGTAGVALVCSTLVFALTHFGANVTRRLVLAGWVAACLLVVPVALLLFQMQAYRANWLPYSVQHRVVIWGHTATLVPKAPFLGAGLAAARLEYDRSDSVPRAPGSPFALTTSVHSHNVYLQVWYEAGALGALIFLGVGLSLLRSISRATPDIQPHLYATFVACALVAASGFSLFAPWFTASLAIVGIFAAFGTLLHAALARA
jgi:O-antigen ligase